MLKDHERANIEHLCRQIVLIILNEFILYHDLLKYPNNRLLAVRISTGSEHVQQVEQSLLFFRHPTDILQNKNTKKKLKFPLLNGLSQLKP